MVWRPGVATTASSTTRPPPRGGTVRRSRPAARRHGRRATTAARTGAGSITAGDGRGRRRRRTHLCRNHDRGTSPPTRWRPAPRNRPPAGRRPAPIPRRTTGPCWTSARSRARFPVGGSSVRRSSVGTRAHGCEIVVPAQAGRPQMRQRHPVRAQHADVAACQRNVSQSRQPLVALVVGEQNLATPDRAVWTVARSVEGESEHLRCEPSSPCSAITAAMCA